jgi:general secretion pathway protein D
LAQDTPEPPPTEQPPVEQPPAEQPRPPDRRRPPRRPPRPSEQPPREQPPVAQPPVEQPPPVEPPKPIEQPLPEQPKPGEENKETAGEGITFTFNNTKLSTLLEYLAKREGKPLLYDDRFPKDMAVSIISPPGVTIPPDKFINVIESVLRMKNFTIVTGGPVIKILVAGEAQQQITIIKKPEEIASLEWTDRIVTQIIPVKSVNPGNMIGLLNALKTPQGSIIHHPDSNSLIITEFASNLRKLNDIIKQLDIEAPAFEVTTKQLKYATAASLKTSVDIYVANVLYPPGQPQTSNRTMRRPFISIDDRTNSLVIYATTNDTKNLLGIIDTLDVESSKQDSTLYTYKLANTSAADIVPIITSIFTAQIAAMPPSVKKPQLTITSDKNTNAMVIMAPPAMYVEIERLIKEMDVKKLQVLIEVAIVELDMEKMVELGIELASITEPTAKPTPFGATSFGMSTLTAEGRSPNITEGLTVGIWKDAQGNIPILLKMAQKDSGIDVKAMPRLLTNDNAAASIKISESIPYDTSTIGPDGRVTAVTFGGYLEAAVNLSITPHISEHDYLRLELEQTVEQFVASAYSTTRPAKTSRTAKTAVTVPDRETVIIGGLTRDNKTRVVSKIPILGDIPLLGYLFQKSKEETKKTNLCIFITPRIMKQFSDLTEESAKYKKTVEPPKK